ncbi:MAG: glycosyl transferase family protein [Pseudomonadota bacterium]
MTIFDFDVWQWLVLLQHELLLFAGIFFLIGAVDDLAVDLTWIWLKLTGRAKTPQLDRNALRQSSLSGDAAVFIPTWQEAEVIGYTIKHVLKSWPQDGMRLYIGCYRNDGATIDAVMQAAGNDPRLRVVIHDRLGPSTKADCLNRLYLALCDDERRRGTRAHMVVFHDAEDMVDPAALPLLDQAIGRHAGGAQFVQLPVQPLPQPASVLVGSHYCEEFAEAHGKGMVVRDALGAGLPGAGVGCALEREALEQIRMRHADRLPFETDSLTEDYEMGLSITDLGGRSRFLRARGDDGQLIATRAYFPDRLHTVVRQKTRWVHGIALQGWDRIGWSGGLVESWMRARDRRGPLTAFVLLMGYLLLAISAVIWGAVELGQGTAMPLSPALKALLWVNFIAFIWRASWRFAFTARIYGVAEGLMAIVRIPITNIISIMAGRRALVAYIASLRGRGVVWDKTHHTAHPMRFDAVGEGQS